jgi:hypothetical protein
MDLRGGKGDQEWTRSSGGSQGPTGAERLQGMRGTSGVNSVHSDQMGGQYMNLMGVYMGLRGVIVY